MSYMTNITQQYIAGLLDGDGSFQLQIKFRGQKGFQINPRVLIGFKNLPKEKALLQEIQKFLNAGKIYISNKGKENAIIRFYTTNLTDTSKVCKVVIPFLKLKKEQATKLLKVCNLMKSKKSQRYCKGFQTSSMDIYSKAEMTDIIIIATTMNEGTQMNRFRNAKGRDTHYYLKKLNQIYD